MAIAGLVVLALAAMVAVVLIPPWSNERSLVQGVVGMLIFLLAIGIAILVG